MIEADEGLPCKRLTLLDDPDRYMREIDLIAIMVSRNLVPDGVRWAHLRGKGGEEETDRSVFGRISHETVVRFPG